MASIIKDLPYIPAEGAVAIVKTIQSSGTTGQSFGTKNQWNSMTLNTVEGDSSLLSVSSNQITLQPGSYMVIGKSPCTGTIVSGSRLYDTANSSVILQGNTNICSGVSNQLSVDFQINGIIEVNEATTMDYQVYNTGTMGIPVSFGVDEVFTILIFLKI
jgi:hypothetical protein